jgi:hypothetical protein
MGKKRWKMNCDLDALHPWEQAQTLTVWGLNIHQDRSLTIRMIADELNECKVHQIVMQDFNMRTVYAVIVTKNFSAQKACWNKVLAEMLDWFKLNEIFLIGTKVGFLNMTQKPKGRVRNGTCHSLQDRRKLTWVNKNQDNGRYFFNSRGVVHKEFLPPGVTMELSVV